MKILHIGKYYPPFFGGIEKVNFDLVESFNEKGIQTDVLCFNHNPGTTIDELDYKVIRASVVISKFSTPISFSFRKQLRRIYKDYDIIHIHVPNPVAAVYLQFLKYQGKIVLHWHLDIVKQKILKRFYLPFQNHLLKKADAVIVTSPTYLEKSLDLRRFRDKCKIIPLGIDGAHLKDNLDFRNELDETYAGKKVVFGLGRLIYYKGFEFLVEAASKTDKDTVILIGGIGELHDDLSALIKRRNLENKVKLLGKIPHDQIAEYYIRADVFCLPSVERSEAFGIVLIEAMSFGCPVISTEMGSGTSWVNQHESTGLVVEPKNSSALADAIKTIINNPELRNEFSMNAKKRYTNEFQLKTMIDRTLELYRQL